ncbi:MAG: aminotransferase class III-fold pyridoxal phosphate-dependent enzyme, partial [Veillonella sp.]|nr:aminotransferase class III-fold pyridoxal phosphate-dependent enzyme [Veillonella sp.]
ELDGAPGVKSLSGFGLMLGIETNANPRSIIDACLQEGLVVLSAKSKIRLLPALNIPQEDLEKGIAILKKVIGDLANE